MNKLIILAVILIILLTIYWYQSKLDDKYESKESKNLIKVIKEERISLTDSPTYNNINIQESEEDNQTLKSFNMEVLDDMKDDNYSKTNLLIKDDKDPDCDSHFTDSDLREESVPTMDEQLDNIE